MAAFVGGLPATYPSLYRRVRINLELIIGNGDARRLCLKNDADALKIRPGVSDGSLKPTTLNLSLQEYR